jgi:hypothetical protein
MNSPQLAAAHSALTLKVRAQAQELMAQADEVASAQVRSFFRSLGSEQMLW